MIVLKPILTAQSFPLTIKGEDATKLIVRREGTDTTIEVDVDNIVVSSNNNVITSTFNFLEEGEYYQLIVVNGIGNLRVPTETELNNERLSWSTNNAAGAFNSPLKLTVAGLRNGSTSVIEDVNTVGGYWSSTIISTLSRYLYFGSSFASMNFSFRASGYSVRLILNGTFTQQEFNDDYLGETIVIEGLTYGYVYNSTTNKIWLDRNLGATQVATSSTDTDAYGWLYQWGRLTDGHQIRTSTTTAILSSTDVPLTDDFITAAIAPFDWRTPQNNNLWQQTTNSLYENGLNIVCRERIFCTAQEPEDYTPNNNEYIIYE
jgi:hypothetical protein